MRIWPFTVLLSASSIIAAGPADYVFTPAIEQGELEIDLVSGWARQSHRTEREFGLGIGRGLTQWWSSELIANVSGGNGASTRLDAFEWENKILLTTPGRYSFDLGLVSELEIPRSSGEAKEIKFGAMAQRRIGVTQLNLNLLLERPFGGDRGDGERETELGYQWQVKHPLGSAVALGLQGFGEVGPWNRWESYDEQEHIAGPAVFGKVPFGEDEVININVGWLLGVNSASSDHTIRAQMEIEL